MIMALFVTTYVTSRDPNRGFLWLAPYFGDLPSSVLSERLVGMNPSLTDHVATYLILGGVQWGLIGLLLGALYKSIRHRPPHATRNT